ncbi:MAG TPA: metal-sulfur cluster assembly factor [Mycobacteriales bacterium]
MTEDTIGPDVGTAAVAEGAGSEEQIAEVYERLHEVIDPEVGVNIVDLGLVYGVRVADRVVSVRMTLTTPGCPLGSYIDDSIRRALDRMPDVDDTDLDLVWDPPWTPEMMTDEAKRQLGWMR